MEEIKQQKKILIAENLKENKEKRILKKFDETKSKWDKQSKLIKEKTKKKETLADQGDKYREKNELNILIDYLNKEEKKKNNWTENLRYGCEKIKFKESVIKIDLNNKISKNNKKLFDKVFEKNDGKKELNQEYYKKNKDIKKEENEKIIIEKIKNNLEFVLSNFAIPLDNSFCIKGDKIEINKLCEENNLQINEEKQLTDNEINDKKEVTHIKYDNLNIDNVDNIPNNKEYLKVSCSVIEIKNFGTEVINKCITLTNCSSSIIIYQITFKKNIKLKNEVIHLKDAIYFDNEKNYNIFISPNTGYINPKEKIKINFSFIFYYFVNSFGCFTIKYLCNNKIFKKYIFLDVNSFYNITELKKKIKKKIQIENYNKDEANLKNPIEGLDIRKLCKTINFINFNYHLNLNERNIIYFFKIIEEINYNFFTKLKCLIKEEITDYSDKNCNNNNEKIKNKSSDDIEENNASNLKRTEKNLHDNNVFFQNKSEVILVCEKHNYFRKNKKHFNLKNCLNSFFIYMKFKLSFFFNNYSSCYDLNFFKSHFLMDKSTFLFNHLNLNTLINNMKKTYYKEDEKKIELYDKEEFKKFDKPGIESIYNFFINIYEKINYKKENFFHIFTLNIHEYITELINSYKNLKKNYKISKNVIFLKKEICNKQVFQNLKDNDINQKKNKVSKIEEKEFHDFLVSIRNNYHINMLHIFPNIIINNYLNFFINFVYLQNKLNISPTFYFFYYFQILNFIKNLFIKKKNTFYKGTEQNVIIEINNKLLFEILTYIYTIYKNKENNNKINEIKESVVFLFSSIFLYVRQNIKNLYIFFDAHNFYNIINQEKNNLFQEEFCKNVFFLFLFPYLRNFISQISNFKYELYFLKNYDDIMQFCENYICNEKFEKEERGEKEEKEEKVEKEEKEEKEEKVEKEEKEEKEEKVEKEEKEEKEEKVEKEEKEEKEEKVEKEEKEEKENTRADKDSKNEYRDENEKVGTYTNKFSNFDTVKSINLNNPEENKINFFDNFHINSEYIYEKKENLKEINEIKEMKNSNKNENGNIFFISDKKMFSKIVYEYYFEDLKKKTELNLLFLKKIYNNKIKKNEEEKGENSVIISVTGEEKIKKKKKKKGKEKEKEKEKENLHNNECDNREEQNTEKEKKKKKKKERGNNNSSFIKSKNGEQNLQKDNKKENKEFIQYYFIKIFEILNVNTYIIDDKKMLSNIRSINFCSRINIKTGPLLNKKIYSILFIFNLISVEHLNHLYKNLKSPNYYLYSDYIEYNRKTILILFKEIIQYFDLQNNMNKNNFLMKLPLDTNFDFLFIQLKNMIEDKQKICIEEKYDKKENEEDNYDKEKISVKDDEQNWTTEFFIIHFNKKKEEFIQILKNNIKREELKYICIISPNIKNSFLNFSNLKKIIEWIKLLNMLIFFNISDVYICGDLLFIFLFFIYDNHIIKGKLCKNKNDIYIKLDTNKSIKRKNNYVEMESMYNTNNSDNIYLQIFDIHNFPHNLLLLLKISIFNILNLYKTYNINIHFPFDIYIKSDKILNNSSFSMYCLLPYKNYTSMINSAKKNFLNKYKNKISKMSFFENKQQSPYVNNLININPNEKKNNEAYSIKKGFYIKKEEKEKEDSYKTNMEKIDANFEITSLSKEFTEKEKDLTSSQVKNVCLLNIGKLTVSNILKNIKKENKILWLCGSFEKNIKENSETSLKILEYFLNYSSYNNNIIHVNNLIILNKRIYYLYYYHISKKIHITFLFNSYKFLVKFFDTKYSKNDMLSLII
ncbi:conserved Plasmodium protein, unknown function [Plasmodium relictum]|uniref:Uncharacterized protein n=1 Tax=Plasmodium relictum TaxID=85471 RepID=A0A1J1H2C6_PLARL|nr:conserved Plasmodium protein, unknown function [Plasmodium relictum]CRG99067.1 conserved Plasmodium protein, unknown function [Plasmodium relictum]